MIGELFTRKYCEKKIRPKISLWYLKKFINVIGIIMKILIILPFTKNPKNFNFWSTIQIGNWIRTQLLISFMNKADNFQGVHRWSCIWSLKTGLFYWASPILNPHWVLSRMLSFLTSSSDPVDSMPTRCFRRSRLFCWWVVSRNISMGEDRAINWCM